MIVPLTAGNCYNGLVNQKGQTGILILVGILIIAAVAGGAYYFGTQRGSLPSISLSPSPTPDASTKQDGCRPTGCSGQICSDEDVITTCEYRAEYACYKNAKCERQKDGKCGWTQTEELKACLKNPLILNP